MISRKSGLQEFREGVQRCMRCGFCVALCPTWEFVGWESGSPRGRMQIIKALLENRATANNLVMDRMYNCTLCGYCLWRCPPGVETTEAIKAARAFLVERNLFPKAVEDLDKTIRESRSIYGLASEARTEWIDYLAVGDAAKTKKKAEFVYFVGCVASLSGRAMGIAAATSRILNELGLDWTLLSGEECCGNPLLLGGKPDFATALADHNVARIKETRARAVVTSCPGCHRTLTQEYPRLIGDLGFEVYHVSQILEDAMDRGRLKFRDRVEAILTYHDPCELGRHSGIYEPPRRILENIPGIVFVDLFHNRALTSCCGSGGLLKTTYPDIALKLGFKKVDEAHAVNASILSSACPSCKLNILDATSERNDTLEILDLSEVVAGALGLQS